jgi:hypothetical protein
MQDHVPFKFLRFASNSLENVTFPITLKGKPVVLIGSGGDFPRIWLSIPADETGSTWRDIVVDNEVKFDVVPGANLAPIKLVKQSLPVPTVEVWIARLPLLRARKEAADSGLLEFVDLRPIGLNIVGSSQSLRIGTNEFSNNRISNAVTMVSSN